MSPTNSTCLIKCPQGYWANATAYECQQCPTGCSACFGSTLQQCTVCSNVSGTLYYLGVGTTTCNTSCPDGQYISSLVPFVCLSCSPACLTCQDTADNCTSDTCAINYFYLNNSCLANCPDNYYYHDSTLRQCQQCSEGCLKCFGAGLDHCSQCYTLANGTEYFLQADTFTCTLLCDSDQYGLNNRCYSCPSGCTSCSNYSTCGGCQSVNGVAYYLNGS